MFLQLFHIFTLKLTPQNTDFERCTGSYFPEHTTSSSSSSSKRPRLDQIPAANLDADDPLTDVRARAVTDKWMLSGVWRWLRTLTNVW